MSTSNYLQLSSGHRPHCREPTVPKVTVEVDIQGPDLNVVMVGFIKDHKMYIDKHLSKPSRRRSWSVACESWQHVYID